APGTGSRLRVTVGAALEGGRIDSELDPFLALVSIRVGTGQETLPLDGTVSEVLVDGKGPTELEITVSRSELTTVLFEFDAEGI
ncbi:MAG: hypothetical protein WBH03_04515, partial [Cyclobacteriaceae bacterium]